MPLKWILSKFNPPKQEPKRMTLHSQAIDDWMKSESKNRAAQVPQQKGISAPSYYEHSEQR